VRRAQRRLAGQLDDCRGIPEEERQEGFALNSFSAVRLINELLPVLRDSKAGARSFVPLGRYRSTTDVAEVVTLLVSDRGKRLTGANYRVDGGTTARWPGRLALETG
jgi:NAD(P)-dependent dehydrogenase (short-subunit alcohol dehydrogenase family)